MSADLDLLKGLHTLTIKTIIAKLESGEATAADVTAAINMLKHNGINADEKTDPNLKKAKQIVDAVFSGPDDFTVQ